jgi:hypothetical protein
MNDKGKTLVGKVKAKARELGPTLEERVERIERLQSEFRDAVNEIVPPGAPIDEITEPIPRALLLLLRNLAEQEQEILRVIRKEVRQEGNRVDHLNDSLEDHCREQEEKELDPRQDPAAWADGRGC